MAFVLVRRPRGSRGPWQATEHRHDRPSPETLLAERRKNPTFLYMEIPVSRLDVLTGKATRG